MHELVAARLDAQLLSRADAREPATVVERLLAIQGQDPRGFRLAIRARSTGLTVRDVDASLDDGTLVVSWLNRGTLHLVRAVDYWELFALTAPQQATANNRRLRQTGVDEVDAERGIAAIGAAVAAGPRTRAELGLVLDTAGVPTNGQALVHLLYAAALQGLVVRGPLRDGEHAYVSAPDWIGPRSDVDLDRALAWLARRYLAGHGPAEARDLAIWAGISLGTARRALGAIAGELRPREDGLVDLAGRGLVHDPPAPRLLGSFDPLLHGWVSRETVTSPHTARIAVGGVFRPTALVDGRAVATWTLSGSTMTLTPLEPLEPDVERVLDDDAAAVGHFLRLPRLTIRYG